MVDESECILMIPPNATGTKILHNYTCNYIVAVAMTFLTLSSGDQQVVQLSFLKFSNSPRTCICVWIVFYFCIICVSLPAMGVSPTQRWTELVQCFLYKTAWTWHCFIGELQYLWLLMKVLKQIVLRLSDDHHGSTCIPRFIVSPCVQMEEKWQRSCHPLWLQCVWEIFFTIWDEGHTKTSASIMHKLHSNPLQSVAAKAKTNMC